jgi:hypothetical protein
MLNKIKVHLSPLLRSFELLRQEQQTIQKEKKEKNFELP